MGETIEVPGATLSPGEYVVKLVDSDSNRHIVQFLNAEETEVLTTVLAIPNQRLEPTGDTTFTFYETPAGSAPALRAWFYPGDTFGQEFAYPKERAQQLSKATNIDVPVAPDDNETATLTERPTPREPERDTAATQRTTPAQPQARPQPEPVETPEVVEREEPTTLAQAQPAPARPAPQQQQEPTPADEQPTQTTSEDRLPDTATPAPLLGLVGLGAFAAAMGLRRLSRR